MLGMESMNGRMSRLAKDEMNIGRFYSLKDILREIDSVTTQQIHRLALEHFTSRGLSLTTMGPVSNGSLPKKLAC